MIAVGDVHGCYKTLMALIDKLPHNRLIFVGDLIDRGPQSKDVVDYVIKNNHYCVMGNHEDMMTEPAMNRMWLNNGGDKTLKSYKDEEGNFVYEFEIHKEWMEKLPLVIEYKNFIITHSAVFGMWDIDHQSNEFITDALWNRNFNDKNTLPEGRINIFGHTPVEDVVEEDHFMMIDGGCFYKSSNYNKLGKLFAYDMDADVIYEQENIED